MLFFVAAFQFFVFLFVFLVFSSLIVLDVYFYRFTLFAFAEGVDV